MISVVRDGAAAVRREGDEVVQVEPWGPHAVRVRVAIGQIRHDIPHALLEPEPSAAEVEIDGDAATILNGRLRLRLDGGRLSFSDSATDRVLLAEGQGHFAWPGPRSFSGGHDGYYRIEQPFAARADERVYGLGQHRNGALDQKGMVLDLVQRNAEVTIPFCLSNLGYGFLWNSPAVGRVELAANGTRWVADSARQIDYWVTAGSPREVLSAYADATGHAPMLPDFAAGYWQSKLMYRTQGELLEVAREYHRRGIPLAVIVTDYLHWTHMGEWAFDRDRWPDPAAMVKELSALGVRLMPSIWPAVNPLSRNYETMRAAGHLVGTQQGTPAHHSFPDKGFGGAAMGIAYYDATNPDARRFVWEQVKQEYYDIGCRVWWLDGCEPEIYPESHANLRYAAGPGTEVANLYPRENARTFFEGMRSAGERDIVLLARSAWAGSQRYAAALWSGDIATTWQSLREQVAAGLNVMCSGIPWWNSDTGGFHGGDPDDEAYRELYVRWFQFATFCPIMRAHGHREPRIPFDHPDHGGGGNEVWSYGAEAEEILVAHVRLRETLKPYLLEHMRAASETGIPVMRPLFVEHPDDPAAWKVADSYLFGPDLLIAPVLEPGQRERPVYLPAGADWVDARTGTEYTGGQTVVLPAPLEHCPVLVRAGAPNPISDSHS